MAFLLCVFSGGRQISVTGKNLNAIQMPKIFIRNIQDGRRSKAEVRSISSVVSSYFT